MRLFYINPEQIQKNRAEIRGEEARHIIRVLRLHAGDNIRLLDGFGFSYEATIREMSGTCVQAEIRQRQRVLTESPLSVTVAQALIKDRKMDRLVRQLTEIGVTRWIAFSAQRSVPRIKRSKVEARIQRWEKISIEAIKQCRRGRPMQIEPPMDFEAMLMSAETADLKLICWEGHADASGKSFPEPERPLLHCFIAIGPEGGFTEIEVAAAEKAGFLPVSLGPRILRAETAALAAAVLVQHRFGDIGNRSNEK